MNKIIVKLSLPKGRGNWHVQWMIIVVALFISNCADAPRTVYSESFDRPNLPENFFVEGSDKAAIKQGRLWMDASPEVKGESGVGTIWLNKEFSGDLKVEFDVCILQSKGKKNNINFFSSIPIQPESLCTKAGIRGNKALTPHIKI